MTSISTLKLEEKTIWQMNPQKTGKTEIMKIRGEINEMENRKQ